MFQNILGLIQIAIAQNIPKYDFWQMVSNQQTPCMSVARIYNDFAIG